VATSIKPILLTIILLFISGCATNQQVENSSMNFKNKIVIAHRGASGYLPEHTLAAKAMAHAMDADYIEQDVVMTKDDQIVVLHDPFLDRVTDVMDKFPNRFRTIDNSKRWLAIDFTLAEIKTLQVSEGFKIDESGIKSTAYPGRFPLFKSSFQVNTLAEEIELIQGLNKSTGKNIGIYVEIKAPWLHRMEGKDISLATLKLIKSYGYSNKTDKAYIQCFDPNETKRIRMELYPALSMDLPLVQLIAETEWGETMTLKDGKLSPYSYDWVFQPGAMSTIADYADGIGPWKPMLVTEQSSLTGVHASMMLNEAKQAGLIIHPYTFRKDKGRIPEYAKDFNDLLDIFYRQLAVDGIFTDFPDLAVQYLNSIK